MNTFDRVKAWTEGVLADAGIPGFSVYPGPELPSNPDRAIVVGRYGGPGLDLDGVTDGKSWQFRVIGAQDDYNSAEIAADAIDVAALGHFSSDVDGVWVTNISRVGGAPYPLMVDTAQRTHFVCSYVIDTAMALSN